MILPVLAKRMQFKSRLSVLMGLAPSNQPITELGPPSTNQILGLLGLGTLKSANHRAGTNINQSDSMSAGKVGPKENPTSHAVKVSSPWA